MKGARNTGFVVSLVLLASLVSHFAIQRHFERRDRSRINPVESDSSFSSQTSMFGPRREKSEIEGLKMPRFLEPKRRIVPALDVQEGKDHETTGRIAHPPAEVPPPTDAVGLESSSNDRKNADNEESSAVREVIEKELSHATREEREIWFDELKTLPAGVVRDLLQVRKQLRALPRVLGGIPEKLVSADPTMMNHPHEVPAETVSQKIRFTSTDHLVSAAALESAISQLRHNVTNAATPGFKRLRITLVDAYGSASRESCISDDHQPELSVGAGILGEGCRNAPLILDLKQGVLKKTARQFDLAIDGDGFFVVRRGEREYLTRCGVFTLDRDRQLSLAVTSDNIVLQPQIKIPDEAREIQVSAQGVVTVLKTGDTTLTTIGQLQLAYVASPSRLQPEGNALFVATENSGAVILGLPMAKGLGEIQQGFLERSNVELDKELEEIEELTSILKSLPPYNPRPATANAAQQLQKR